MGFIKPFRELGKKDARIAGGKGASLGEMTQAGIPIPTGFVVLTQAFEMFLKKTGLSQKIDAALGTVNPDEMSSIEHASEKIRALILAAKMPHDIEKAVISSFHALDAVFVAVRSSATAEDSSAAAWAGQLDSFLNTTIENLLENVKRCWASLFTPRAIFYRFEKKMNLQSVSVAVVVQKMVQSEVSGIAFSVHPVTQDRNQMIIEAGYGLGEAIVSGQITPDSYVVKKKEMALESRSVAVQERGIFKDATSKEHNSWKQIPAGKGKLQKLSDQQIITLAGIILGIERHYGFPVDVEWALEQGKFSIVQSRPITTLQTAEEMAQIKETEKIILSSIYTRDKSLMYFQMWDQSDRKGYEKYLGHNVRCNLLLKPSAGRKTTIYYDKKELGEIDSILKVKVEEPEFLKGMCDDLDKAWGFLEPYANAKTRIATVEEFYKYYNALVNFWAALNTPYTLPKLNVDKKHKDVILRYRKQTERYTAMMGNLLHEFVEREFP